MASQKLTNCCVVAMISLPRRTLVHLIAQSLRALLLALFAYPSTMMLFLKSISTDRKN
jgi:hypothetical protein